MDFYNQSQWLVVDFSDVFWEISFQRKMPWPLRKSKSPVSAEPDVSASSFLNFLGPDYYEDFRLILWLV